MTKYFWMLRGGDWLEVPSIDDLIGCYRRSGNLQNDFIAVELNEMGEKVNITDKVKKLVSKQTKNNESTTKRQWWKFWKQS
jgi:hypothetical protein